MPTDRYNAYLEASILTAEPVELVRILYRGALDAVGDARACLAAGDIPGRSKAVAKADGIIRELTLSISPASAPALAHNLRELYDYIGRRLLATHAEQSDAPLAEVAGLLATMAGAWEGVELPDTSERVEMVAAEA
jgi:flagellar secretion chaperone FliS